MGRALQVRPTTPRLRTAAAEQLAIEVLERREESQDELGRLPDHDDLLGVVLYVLAHESDVPVKVFIHDLLACLSIVVSTRRQLDELELAYLDLGRELGVPNKLLGRPFGRLDQHATWKARSRLRAASSGGRHEVTPADHSGDPNATVLALHPESVEGDIRLIAAGLLAMHESLAPDENLDEWLRWLKDAGFDDELTPLSRGAVGLLWTVIDDVADALRDGKLLLAQPEVETLHGLVAAGASLRRRLRAQDATEAVGQQA